jgi:cytochrome c peroxidase
MKRHHAWMTCALATVVIAGCSGDGSEGGEREPVADTSLALTSSAQAGKHFFDNPLAQTNGRSCATCHTESEHTTLHPASVSARFAADPTDPLFHPLDADDPSAAELTYDHLKQGLIRVTLELPSNVDVIDADGNVITSADRTVFVWRGVPTIENTALTGPYLSDGRGSTLEEQAEGALFAHSQIAHAPPEAKIHAIAAFERTVFSSPGVQGVFAAIQNGETPPDPDPAFAPGSDEAAGKALFQEICAQCHGGPSGDKIVNRAVHDQLFFALNPDGSIQFTTPPGGTPVPVLLGDHKDDEFVNYGFAAATALTQIPVEQGGIPNPTGLTFPHYRLRFYTDASRTQKVVDLPPPPPLIGPSLFPQPFSVDPGRALITGDPADFEAFDVPQLRGIAQTAPYFHDNSVPNLETTLDIYSMFIIPVIPALGRPAVVPPAGPGLPPEALTAQEKAQLIAYLKKI